MSETQVCINLSEELARLMFSSNEENGLSLIRSLPELSVKARGNSLTIDGDFEKIKIIKQFIKILNTRIGLSIT